jgi:hypothetical protein
MQIDFLPPAASRSDPGRYIFIACPWTPKGGGMYKVADYLIQAQADPTPGEAARLRPLDTRGDRNSLWSLWVLSTALARLVRGRLSGELVGVHVNMAERLSLFRKSAVVVVSHGLGLPVVLHLHAAQLHHFYRRLPSPLQAFTRWTFSLADQVVVLGSESRRFVAHVLRQLLLQPTLRQTLERNGRAIYRQPFSLGRFFSGVASIHQRHFGIAAVPCSPAVNTARAGQVGCPDLEKNTP